MKLVWIILFIFSSLSATLEVDVGTGYRIDSLNWNIGSPTGTPNILSELSWKNVSMINYYGQVIYDKQFYARFIGEYGYIFHGTVQDSDFNGNNRTQEFSRSISDASRGEAYDLSIGIGCYKAALGCITLVPLIGIARQEQHLTMHNGKLLINTNGEIGPISNLHSNYRAKWNCPWVGFDLIAIPCNNLRLKGSFEGQWCRYRGTGHWNLRDDFLDDFKHSANGWGVIGRLEVDYKLLSCLSLGLLGEYQYHWAREGADRIKVAEGTVHQPLNHVNWYSSRIMLTTNYYW